MRISDWSSDVCSSDLSRASLSSSTATMRPPSATSAWPSSTTPSGSIGISQRGASSRSTVCMTESKAGTVELEARSLTEARPYDAMPVVEYARPIDRKSVGEGKSASLGLDHGGRRILKKKKRPKHKEV